MKETRTNCRKYPYDAWLHWNVTDGCNLNCVYCFAFNDTRRKTAEMSKIDIPSLIRTLEKTNKIFRVQFTGGGEPFLVPNIIDACVALSKRHYLGFNTNLTSDKISELVEKIDPSKVVELHASCHIKELERLNLLDMYIDNFMLCQEAGFKIQKVYEVAYPPLADEVQKYKKFFRKNGIKLEFLPFIGKYESKEYPKSYTEEEFKVFDLKVLGSSGTAKHFQSENICNAGYNVGVLSPDGNIQTCWSINDTIGNIYEKIEFKKSMKVCPLEFCTCPLKVFDPYLFERALKETAAASDKPGFISRFASFIKNR